ncbi:hypothetical protein [Moorena producens]|uniref:hypothetical protein n=1 Tax=Moorena producens TaxID=1155739 RepID=UPI001313DB10|nr:hypothetical protein [Moorena producens]
MQSLMGETPCSLAASLLPTPYSQIRCSLFPLVYRTKTISQNLPTWQQTQLGFGFDRN